MPVMSGFEATRVIRDLESQSNGRMKRSFIIALTGLAGEEDLHDARIAGVDVFLTKPVMFSLVDQEVEKWRQRIAR